MAPSRACKYRQPHISLLLVALVFCAVVESKDYFSDPSGKLHGKFPADVIQEAAGPVVQESSYVEPREQDAEQEEPLEIYDMLSEGDEVAESQAKKLEGGELSRRVTRDAWSDPSGPLNGRFSEEVVEEAVKGHRKKHHGKKAHGKKDHGKEKGHKGSEDEDTQFEIMDLLADDRKTALDGKPEGGRKEKGSGMHKGKGQKHLSKSGLVNATEDAAGDAIHLLREEAEHSPKAAKSKRHAKTAEAGPKKHKTKKHFVHEQDGEEDSELELGMRDRSKGAGIKNSTGAQKGFRSMPKGPKNNSTRARAQSLKWGRKAGGALEKDSTEELDKTASAKLVANSRSKPHKHHHAAKSKSWDDEHLSKSKDDRSVSDRRGLTEADNAKLVLIDVVTQTAAVRAVVNTTEGTPVSIPAGGDGVNLVAVKLNTAQLEASGFTLQNVVIPPGVTVPGNPAVIILVFSEFTDNPYGFTNQTVAAPVVGVSAYDAADPNAGAANSTLDLTALPAAPFQIAFNVTPGANLSCSIFDETAGQLVNTTTTTKLTAPGVVTCTTTSLGTFTVTSTGALAPVPAPAPAPAPIPAPGPAPAPVIVAAPPANVTAPPVASNTTNSSTTPGAIAAARDGGSSISGGAIAGIVIGSVAGLALLALLALLLARRSHNSKIARMVHRSRNSEPLTTALIGGQQGYRAPVASQVRTRPGLEGEAYP